MFEVTRSGENRLDIHLTGKLDKAEMRRALEALTTGSEGIDHGRMLYCIEKIDLPSLGAIGVELAHIPRLFRVISKFDKAAVLAETQWLRRMGEIEGAFIPGLTIKSFGLDQKAEAEAWLAA